MKRIAFFALLGMLTTVIAMADDPVTMTITFKNNAVVTHNAADYDSVRYVGGEFGSATGVGLKIYKSGRSTDYLYSQILSIVTTVDVTTPTFSPDGGTITGATQVTISSSSGTTIYYTLDGSTPTTASPLNGPSPVTITISETTTVKAIAAFGTTVSEMATAQFEKSTTFDNNTNRNQLSPKYTSVTSTYEGDPNNHNYVAWHLEFPRMNEVTNNTWVVHEYDTYGISYSLEWSNTDIANRWTCYQFSSKNNMNNLSKRYDGFKADDALPSATRSELADYSSSGYTRGHLCPSADRRMTIDINKETCFLSNMQPQWDSHNSGIWASLESTVNGWAGGYNYSSSKSTKKTAVGDTLYIVKAATISSTVDLSSVNADSVAVRGVFYKANGTQLLCNDRLPVPKYFYMAVLSYTKSSSDTGDGTYHGTFKAIGLWTRHWDKTNFEVITIDELEKRTGIDFFCNLPDDVEATVEATVDKSFWGMTAY